MANVGPATGSTLARFGESHGFEYDKMRENAWPYRDYVVRSFNEDKSYLQFLEEQLAGDVLEPLTHDGIIGSSFLVAGPWDEVANGQVGQLMKARAREDELEEIISAVGQTFLGVTINCARCHAHKFDPIPQSDYYRVKAVFEGVRYGDRPILTPAELTIRSNEVERLNFANRSFGRADCGDRTDRTAGRSGLEESLYNCARSRTFVGSGTTGSSQAACPMDIRDRPK